MTSLVFVTQTVDEADPVLAVVPGLIAALAARLEHVTVIANSVARPLPDLPSNVTVASLGKEVGASRLARGLRYQRLLVRIARRGRADVLFAHMCPEYVNLAVPVAKAFRFPTMLWFAHPARSPALTLADKAADAILTSLPGAYPLPSSNVRVIGQATDTRSLKVSPWRGPHRPLRVVAIGRTSPAKGFDIVIRAVAACVDSGHPVDARIIGPSLTTEERRHREALVGLVSSLGLDSRIRIEPSMPPDEIRRAIGRADVLVNAMVAGSGDKVVFEAGSLGRPVIASNPGFAELLRDAPLDLTFPEGDADALADRLRSIGSTQPSAIRETARTLRRRIEAEHSLDHWADAVVRLGEALAARGRHG